jgi:hypothetical protein
LALNVKSFSVAERPTKQTVAKAERASYDSYFSYSTLIPELKEDG